MNVINIIPLTSDEKHQTKYLHGVKARADEQYAIKIKKDSFRWASCKPFVSVRVEAFFI